MKTENQRPTKWPEIFHEQIEGWFRDGVFQARSDEEYGTITKCPLGSVLQTHWWTRGYAYQARLFRAIKVERVASECADMGYDPIEAVRALPEMLRVLDTILPGPPPELDVILAALIHVGPDIIEQMGLEPSHCILSTAIAVDVLYRFGINAKPLSVRTIACNQVWRDWLDNDKLEGAMPEAAWAVGVTDDNPAADGWNGHLVAFVEEEKIIVDLNLGQFARPQKSIRVPPAGVFRDFEAEDNNPHFYRINDTTTLCYDARVNDRSYELTTDWRKQDRYDPVVKKVVDFVIESLYTPNKMTAEERG